MKVKNVTNKNEFLKAMERGLFGIELVEDQDGKSCYLLIDNRLGRMEWTLCKMDNENYSLEYKGKEDPFRAYFTVENNSFEVVKAKHKGKTLKAEKYLKKFNHICMYAHCYILFDLCN